MIEVFVIEENVWNVLVLSKINILDLIKERLKHLIVNIFLDALLLRFGKS